MSTINTRILSEIVKKYITDDLSNVLSILGFTPEEAITIIYNEFQCRGYDLTTFYPDVEERVRFIVERCNLLNLPKFENHIRVISRLCSENGFRYKTIIDICVDNRCLPSNTYVGSEEAYNEFLKEYKVNKKNHICFECYDKIPPPSVSPPLKRQNASVNSGNGFFEYKCKYCKKEEICFVSY